MFIESVGNESLVNKKGMLCYTAICISESFKLSFFTERPVKIGDLKYCCFPEGLKAFAYFSGELTSPIQALSF